MQHPWIGNIRELQSAIKYVIVRSTSDVITLNRSPDSVKQHSQPPSLSTTTLLAEPDSNRFRELRAFVQQLIDNNQSNIQNIIYAEVDKVLYEQVLNHVAGHPSQAAEILGVFRTTFRHRLQSLGMNVSKVLKTTDDRLFFSSAASKGVAQQ